MGKKGKDIAGILIICFSIFVLYKSPEMFRAMDCNNARRALAAIERCEESGACMLTGREFRMKESYERMKAFNCNKD